MREPKDIMGSDYISHKIYMGADKATHSKPEECPDFTNMVKESP